MTALVFVDMTGKCGLNLYRLLVFTQGQKRPVYVGAGGRKLETNLNLLPVSNVEVAFCVIFALFLNVFRLLLSA